jgi:hypothetical protein
MKKPWGRSGHPWLSIPISGLDLWVAFFKIKIKEVEVRKEIHGSSFDHCIKILNILISNCQGNFKTIFCGQT